MSKTIVFGHKNPDTDTITSAIVYAYLKQQLGVDAEAVRLGEVNNETQFALDKFGFTAPRLIANVKDEAAQVILVDHNEFQQSADGIEDVQITEVIDHHRIANFKTSDPLYFRAEPVGCTATILNKLFKENGVEISLDVDFSPKFVVGFVESKEKHPNADKLSVCQVNIGEESVQIVCGAPNARVGLISALAIPGCVIDGHEIQSGKLRGVLSDGMMCSGKELGINDDHSGIIELPENTNDKNEDDILEEAIKDETIFEDTDNSIEDDSWTDNELDKELDEIDKELVEVNNQVVNTTTGEVIEPTTNKTSSIDKELAIMLYTLLEGNLEVK